MSPLRIALVTEDATFSPGLREILDRLVDLGHSPAVIAPGPGPTSYRTAPVRRVSVIDRVGPQVRGHLDHLEPDVALVVSPQRLGRKSLKHARRTGVPTVVAEHSALLDVSADYWRRKVADRADRVVVSARWMSERLRDLDVDAPVWEPGVDAAAFTPALRDDWLHRTWSGRRDRAGTDVVVGHVGDLHKRRGVRHLATLADLPGVRLVVSGEGPERAWLEARLPSATFLGPLATGDLTVALPSFDLLVAPDQHATCAHAARQAAASGVPVVAPRSGGALDVVRHLETGVLYDPRSRHGLREAVDAVARDRFRSLLGDRGRSLAVRRSWADAVDELVGAHLRPLALDRVAARAI